MDRRVALCDTPDHLSSLAYLIHGRFPGRARVALARRHYHSAFVFRSDVWFLQNHRTPNAHSCLSHSPNELFITLTVRASSWALGRMGRPAAQGPCPGNTDIYKLWAGYRTAPKSCPPKGQLLKMVSNHYISMTGEKMLS